ncbi:hypothetical protein TrVGV298_011293 [Trichoderma virens]|nr:hypothetical protein TrVGV298_011293 [Trichoderma virens]
MSHFNVLTATADDLQRELSAGGINSKQLVKIYLSQIERHNDYLKAVISTAPESLLLERASMLDDERQRGKLRSPLHGTPILIKDNIATHPSTGLDTTAGSLALVNSKPRSNAPIVDRNPGGSSSGSAIAVAAGFAPLSIGTETFGSLMLPAGRAALYSIKPGRSLISTTGIIPISNFSDQPGPMTKSTKDLAMLMDIIADPDHLPSGGYASRATASWEGLQIGTLDPEKWKYSSEVRKILDEGMEKQLNDQVRDAYATIKQHVSIFKDNVPLSTADALTLNGEDVLLKIFEKDFKEQFENYLQLTETPQIKSLGELIAFNKKHADRELPPGYDNQDTLERCEKTNITFEDRANYVAHLEKFGRDEGIDKIFHEYDINIVIGPLESPLYYFAAACGYPVAAMPVGYLEYNGRPHGIGAVAKEEGLLIQLQSAYESVFPPRKPPTILG